MRRFRTSCLNAKSSEERVVYKRLNSTGNVDSENNHGGSSRDIVYYIGLDVHKKTISYCVKDASGQVHQEGKIGATRRELDSWTETLPQPRTVAMEATIFTGWIYDHLLPHAQQVEGSASLDAARHRGIASTSNLFLRLAFA
jgi:hypothetical protein